MVLRPIIEKNFFANLNRSSSKESKHPTAILVLSFDVCVHIWIITVINPSSQVCRLSLRVAICSTPPQLQDLFLAQSSLEKCFRKQVNVVAVGWLC